MTKRKRLRRDEGGGRDLDPVVAAYERTDIPLEVIIDHNDSRNTPLLHAILYIEQCLKRRRLARYAINAAMAVPFEGCNPDLLILMLAGWAELSCRITGTSEAEALIHKAQALLADTTPLSVAVRIDAARSIVADTQGNKSKREQILRQILDTLPPSSSRHKSYMLDLAMLLAEQGRLNTMQSDLQTLKRRVSNNFPKAPILLAYFINSVETGNSEDAFRYNTQLQNTPHNKIVVNHQTYRSYSSLLETMSSPDSSSLPDNSPPWLRVVYSLLSRDSSEALRLARNEAGKMLDSILGSGFESLNLIRAELSAGNWEAAGRLLKMRHGRGNMHYLDGLFFARIEHLAGNATAATKSFSKALRDADDNDARGRFDFELRLACELSHGDIIDLFRPPADSKPGQPSVAEKLQSPVEHKPSCVDEIIGRSDIVEKMRKDILTLASSDAPVLITGETGTGKELVARALHETSNRRNKPFIAVNCGTIAETLLESELFGHKRGAFTGAERENLGLFEEAGEGTIFLDEIGEILPRLQTALLRVLETGEIRAVGSTKVRQIKCRILAATNADIQKLADDGLFRKDLIFRLQRLGVHIPPLRERREDIPLLIDHFLNMGRSTSVRATISSELAATLKRYNWRGNVRELKNVIERMRLMHSDKLFYDLDDLDLKFQSPAAQPDPSRPKTEKRAPVKIPLHRAEPPQNGETGDQMEEILRLSKSQIRRLDRLRDLFTEYIKLTRSEIVRYLGVSPNTATKDLKALISEGFIRRVEPSHSTRSHYFQLVQD